ncbi:MAG: helix-turn-helix domain-containing protein [Planctomycetota bacterium]|nr:helix-turn-helix domain-containing protein [Planctomycetota bacterium]
MANGELIDARQAMDLLGIDENKLQTLVARGDLRAFRSAGTMKFRREDVVGLKTEKGTEPTIIIPSAGPRKPGQSGILSAVDAPPAGGSGIAPAVHGSGSGIGPSTDQTGTIVFDDIDFVPTDDAMSTQQQTVVGSAITSGLGDAATMVDGPAVGAEQTGEMTVVDNDALDEGTVSTGPAAPVTAPPPATGSGPRPAAPQPARAQSRVGSSVGPAVSRVRAGVSTAAVARRTATVYEVKSAHPIMTALLILNTMVLLFIGSIFGVMIFKGHYDHSVNLDDGTEMGSNERIIPPYLTKKEGLGVYEGLYNGSIFGGLPGKPADPKPAGEPFSSESDEEPSVD